MLLNLVTNALRVTAEGHVEIRVTEHDIESVTFSVTDSGPGIAPEAMATLFDPFPDPARRGISSTGLGLAICRKLAQAMGSELTVESISGAGACFRFLVKLPLA
jgi:signal transduction histidine kinase